MLECVALSACPPRGLPLMVNVSSMSTAIADRRSILGSGLELPLPRRCHRLIEAVPAVSRTIDACLRDLAICTYDSFDPETSLFTSFRRVTRRRSNSGKRPMEASAFSSVM